MTEHERIDRETHSLMEDLPNVKALWQDYTATTDHPNLFEFTDFLYEYATVLEEMTDGE